MKFKYSPLLLLLLLLFCSKKDNSSKELVVVGERVITTSEFKDRANFSPVLANISLDQHKKNILSSIVAEALLSQLDEASFPPYISLITAQKKREAVIEKFWDDVIFSDITVSDSALWHFYVNTKRQRVIDFAVFGDSVLAWNFFAEWRNNNPRISSVLSKDTLSFSGDIAVLDKSLFYSELDSIARPLRLGRKYLVYKPVKEWQTAALSPQEFNERYKSLRKSYLKTQKQELFIRYAQKQFRKENYQLDRELFKKLTMALEKETLSSPAQKEVNTELLDFSLDVHDGLNPDQVIVNFDDGADLTINDFLTQLAVSPYPLDYTSKGSFRYSLIKASRRMLDDELLYRKALKYNLDNSDYVTWQTAMWRDFYKARALLVSDRYSVKRIHRMLDSLKNEIPVDVRWSVYDTLTIEKSDMVVLKTHFPGQTIVPKQGNWHFKLERD